MATAPKKVVPMDQAAGSAGAPAKSKKKLIFIIIGVLVLLAGGGGAWFFMSKSATHAPAPGAVPALAPVAAAAPAPYVDPSKPPVFLAIDPFTVNLQPEATEQYLQVALTLQVADPTHVEQIKLYMPVIRSRLLMLLTSKKPSELSSEEGKQKLQEEIMAKVRQPFTPQSPPLGVTGVFFTSFVIQ